MLDLVGTNSNNLTSGVAAAGYVAKLSGAGAPALVQPPAASEGPSTISPKIKSDPFAGVVVQFLNNQGAVTSQIPSEAAIAYLRAGLTETGEKARAEGKVI